jgi:hypothetical protein
MAGVLGESKADLDQIIDEGRVLPCTGKNRRSLTTMVLGSFGDVGGHRPPLQQTEFKMVIVSKH